MPTTDVTTRWVMTELDDAQQDAARRLADEATAPPLIARLLVQRGIVAAEDAETFLRPKLAQLHDPALLPGASEAAERIAKAVADRQPIVIYGDYDVDGVTAASILWHMLTHLHAEDVSIYVPHRIDEGYGLNREALRTLKGQHGNPLVISVDCGITAMDEAAFAKEIDLELIITDHHEFNDGEMPDASIVVHPRLPGSGYPFGQLCGAGVAFKLAWQTARAVTGCSDKLPPNTQKLLLNLLSLAALGTVADVVPLVDENRVITTYGLGQIKRTGMTGLDALLDAARLRDEKVDSYHVGFVLGPRLNACGRMGHAARAAHLLTGADPVEAEQIADFLTRENERRRTLERQITTEAEQRVRSAGHDTDEHRGIVVAGEGWHAGVIGIVASRLVDRFHRPAVVLSIEGDTAHGSARSVEGVSIHEALGAGADLLEKFGGHAMAAGLSLRADAIDALRDRLVAYVNERLSPEDLTPRLSIDAACRCEELTLALFESIVRLQPFGRGNPSPTLVTRATIDRQPMRVGQGGKHLKMSLRTDGGGGRSLLGAIGFGLGDWADELAAGVTVDLAFEPKISTWNGRSRPELVVKDLRRG